MDATKVLSCLTDTWTKCLDQYYDHVADQYLKSVSEQYNISLEELKEKTVHLKSDILKKLTHCIPTEINKDNEKQIKLDENVKKETEIESEKKINKDNKIEKLSRKELQQMCKDRGIKTSRKNADMIAAIEEYDKKNNNKEEKHEIGDVQIDHETIVENDIEDDNIYELKEDEYDDEED